MKQQLKTIVPLSLALFVLVSYQFIAASSVWSPAPSTPPNPNADMPIHTGGSQIKSGGLSLNTVATTYGASVGGNLSVGGTANVGNNINVSNNAYVGGLWSGNWVGGNYLRANNQMRSNSYCDWGGGNCTSNIPKCSNGQVVKANGSGGWYCANDDGGSITSITNLIYKNTCGGSSCWSLSCNSGDETLINKYCYSFDDEYNCKTYAVLCLDK